MAPERRDVGPGWAEDDGGLPKVELERMAVMLSHWGLGGFLVQAEPGGCAVDPDFARGWDDRNFQSGASPNANPHRGRSQVDSTL